MRVLLVLALVLVAGCAKPAASPSPAAPARGALSVVSDFQDGAPLAKAHSCDGAGEAPPLVISGAPANAATLALIVTDPDAPFPQAPQQTVTHWTAWNVPLVDGRAQIDKGQMPPGAREGLNSGGKNGYLPPCPPYGSTAHRYVFAAYAIAGSVDLPAGSSRAQLEDALKEKTLANATLTGTYMRLPLG